jgi:hypothetical protein
MENARRILCGQSVEGTDVSIPGIKALRCRIASELAAGVLTAFELLPATPSKRVGSPAPTIELPALSEARPAPSSVAPVVSAGHTNQVCSDAAAKRKFAMPVTPRRTPRFTCPTIGDAIATTKRPLVAAVPSVLPVNEELEAQYPLTQLAEFILGKGYEERLRAGETLYFQVFPGGLDQRTVDLLVAEIEMYIDRSPVVPTYKGTLPNMVHSLLQQAVRQSLTVWIVSSVLFGTAQVISIPSPGVIDSPMKDGRWDIDQQVILQASVSLHDGIQHPWSGLRVEPVFYSDDVSLTMDEVQIGTKKNWMGLQAIQQANACLGCVVLDDSQFRMIDFTDNLAVRATLSSPISQAMLGTVSWEHDSIHRFLPTTQELNMFRGELAAQCPTLASYATDSLRREYFQRRCESWVVARAKAGDQRDVRWLADFKLTVGNAWVEAWVSGEDVGTLPRELHSRLKRSASFDETGAPVKKAKVSEIAD